MSTRVMKTKASSVQSTFVLLIRLTSRLFLLVESTKIRLRLEMEVSSFNIGKWIEENVALFVLALVGIHVLLIAIVVMILWIRTPSKPNYRLPVKPVDEQKGR